jgi:CBS domain-containing protein
MNGRNKVQLPIRTRRVAHAGGLVELDQTVPCPTRGPTPLEVCRVCEQLEEIVHDRDGSECSLTCRPPAGTVDPRAHTVWSHLTERSLPSDADRLPVSTVMRSNITCVTCDMSVEAVAALFLDEDISAVPVVDYEGFTIGILSKTDLLRHRFGRAPDGNTEDGAYQLAVVEPSRVVELMAPVAYTVKVSDSIASAAKVMLDRRVHHVPVVDEQGKVAGMLSTFDFARWIALGPRRHPND